VTDLVLVERPAEGVVVLTLNRPEKFNALSTQLLSAWHRLLTELRQDDDLRALVLTGADPAFCAGLDGGQGIAGAGVDAQRLG
jgi:enoyl-CoA hydratase